MSEKPDKTDKTSASKARYQFRMRHDWHNLIDDLIEEGQKQGVFDNLPGEGKPLNLRRNPYAPETELAFGLLKNNDLKPAWITNRMELIDQIDSLRAEMKQKWGIYEREYQLAQGGGQRNALILGWDDLCQRWQKEIVALNKLIDNFNLKRPSANLELLKLSSENELSRAGARRWLNRL